MQAWQPALQHEVIMDNLQRSTASENRSISFSPGWHLEILDYAAKIHKKGRSEFLLAGIPLKILNLKRKATKVEMLRKFTNSKPTSEKTEIKFECSKDLAEIFKDHCEDFGCDWASLFIIGATTHILGNSHPDKVLDNEFEKMMNSDSSFDGVIP